MPDTSPKTAPSKWDADSVATLRDGYDKNASEAERAAQVETLMETLNRSKRSIVGKLVSEKLYVAPAAKAPAPKDEGPTKADLLADLTASGFDVSGLENATKPAISRVLAAVS